MYARTIKVYLRDSRYLGVYVTTGISVERCRCFASVYNTSSYVCMVYDRWRNVLCTLHTLLR